MRTAENHTKYNIGLLAMNYISCTIVSALDTGLGNLLPAESGFSTAVIVCALSGFVYLASFMLLQFNIQKNGVVLSATFMKLGLLVSVASSIIFFNERPQILQVLGFIIAITAIIIINVEKGGDGKKVKGYGVWLIIMLICSGLGDTFAKVFEELGNPSHSDHYLLFTFAVACVLCLAFMLYKKQKIGKMEMLFGTMIGLPNYLSSKFLLKSLETVNAVIAFPTYCVGVILVVTVVGLFVFKEKLSKKQWIAMAFILVALVLLNI
jgi:drug/metabolite transporter (DMT)-like permease